MHANTLPSPKTRQVRPNSEPSPSEPRLATLASQVIAYARSAKVQRFRYCRRPNAPKSPFPSLQAAADALSAELDEALQQPVCQSAAADFLRELAALTHQPPCQSPSEQQKAARIINNALLELR